MHKELVKYLVATNKELIEKTAIKNCHCIGLNSFIINEKPKIRLFIADDNCELYKRFDYKNPIIAIHPHKYDDLFFQIKGSLIHHIYTTEYIFGKSVPCTFEKWKYLRLSDSEKEIKSLGVENIYYFGIKRFVDKLKSDTLHTACISKIATSIYDNTVTWKDDSCSWIIIETFEDENFEQIGYQNDIGDFGEKFPLLYQKFTDAYEYVSEYVKKL